MTYWLLTSEYPPFYGGGISTYSAFTSKMMSEQGHSVTVFVYDSSVKNIKVTYEDGIRLVRFQPNRTQASQHLGHLTALSYEYAAIVEKFINEEGKPDVIESQEYLGIAYYLLLFKWLGYDWCNGLRIVITSHSPAFLYLPQNHISIFSYPIWWVSEMERFCLLAADMIISPSEFLIKRINEDVKLSLNRIKIIHNPFYGRTNETDNPLEGQVTKEIVLLGKLSVQKGTFHVLKYMEEIWKGNPALRLHLVGDQSILYHPAKKTMGDIIREKYSNRIASGQLVLSEKVHSSSYTKLLNGCLAVIVPSTFDNFPYVVLEAMSMGKIVLASKQGGQREMIADGVNGFLFDHNDPNSFANSIEKILSLSVEERSLISQSAVRQVEAVCDPKVVYQKKREALSDLNDRCKRQPLFPFIRTNAVESEHHFESTSLPLSVVITYFNSGRFLDEVLKNLSNVSLPDFEIIIIDDGSTEEESIIALNKLEGERDIRVVRQNNRGLAAARNRGANEAKGKYLAFLDADDLVEPSYFSKAIAVLDRYPNVHYVGAWTRYFEGSNKIWPTFNPEPPIILYHNTINSSSLVFRKESFLKVGGNDQNMVFKGLEDYDMIIKMAEANMPGVSLPEPLFNYRVRKDSMVRGITAYQKKMIAENMRFSHASLFERFSVLVNNLVAMNGTTKDIDNPSLDYDFADKIPIGGKLALKVASYIKRNKILRPIAYKIYRAIN